jgi:hypothetical protein
LERVRSRKRTIAFNDRAIAGALTSVPGKEMIEVILKRFDTPDETRVFDKGKFEIVKIGGMTIGRARYEPGWKGRNT